MSEGSTKQFPYRRLGLHLRNIREKKLESVVDVSGAVEIESEVLIKIEKGSQLPTEDILLLLISHFGLKNEEAMELWKLAGYDHPNDHWPTETSPLPLQQAAMLVIPIDGRIVYTDLVQVSANNYGIVMNFLQNSGQKNVQPSSVARVGMSREHAESVINILRQVLDGKKSNKDVLADKDKKVSKKDKKSE